MLILLKIDTNQTSLSRSCLIFNFYDIRPARAVMTTTMNIGVGGWISAIIGAIMLTSLLLKLHRPKEVATRLAGKSSIRHMQAATQPMLTPNFVIMMNVEVQRGSAPSGRMSKLPAPTNVMRKEAANKGFVPNLTRSTPAASFATVSAIAAVNELMKISPSMYFISKLTSVLVKPSTYQQSIIMSRFER